MNLKQEICGRCGKQVYHAEKKVAINKVWHQFCFNCVICHKVLNPSNFSTHKGELYCQQCYYDATSYDISFEDHKRRKSSSRSSSKHSKDNLNSSPRHPEIIESSNLRPSEIKSTLRQRRTITTEAKSSEESLPPQFYNRKRRNAVCNIPFLCKGNQSREESEDIKENQSSKLRRKESGDVLFETTHSMFPRRSSKNRIPVNDARQSKRGKKITPEDQEDSAYETEHVKSPKKTFGDKFLPSFLRKDEEKAGSRNAAYSEVVYGGTPTSSPTREDGYSKNKPQKKKSNEEAHITPKTIFGVKHRTKKLSSKNQTEEILFISDSGTTKIVKITSPRRVGKETTKESLKKNNICEDTSCVIKNTPNKMKKTNSVSNHSNICEDNTCTNKESPNKTKKPQDKWKKVNRNKKEDDYYCDKLICNKENSVDSLDKTAHKSKKNKMEEIELKRIKADEKLRKTEDNKTNRKSKKEDKVPSDESLHKTEMKDKTKHDKKNKKEESKFCDKSACDKLNKSKTPDRSNESLNKTSKKDKKSKKEELKYCDKTICNNNKLKKTTKSDESLHKTLVKDKNFLQKMNKSKTADKNKPVEPLYINETKDKSKKVKKTKSQESLKKNKSSDSNICEDKTCKIKDEPIKFKKKTSQESTPKRPPNKLKKTKTVDQNKSTDSLYKTANNNKGSSQQKKKDRSCNNATCLTNVKNKNSNESANKEILKKLKKGKRETEEKFIKTDTSQQKKETSVFPKFWKKPNEENPPINTSAKTERKEATKDKKTSKKPKETFSNDSIKSLFKKTNDKTKDQISFEDKSRLKTPFKTSKKRSKGSASSISSAKSDKKKHTTLDKSKKDKQNKSKSKKEEMYKTPNNPKQKKQFIEDNFNPTYSSTPKPKKRPKHKGDDYASVEDFFKPIKFSNPKGDHLVQKKKREDSTEDFYRTANNTKEASNNKKSKRQDKSKEDKTKSKKEDSPEKKKGCNNPYCRNKSKSANKNEDTSLYITANDSPKKGFFNFSSKSASGTPPNKFSNKKGDSEEEISTLSYQAKVDNKSSRRRKRSNEEIPLHTSLKYPATNKIEDLFFKLKSPKRKLTFDDELNEERHFFKSSRSKNTKKNISRLSSGECKRYKSRQLRSRRRNEELLKICPRPNHLNGSSNDTRVQQNIITRNTTENNNNNIEDICKSLEIVKQENKVSLLQKLRTKLLSLCQNHAEELKEKFVRRGKRIPKKWIPPASEETVLVSSELSINPFLQASNGLYNRAKVVDRFYESWLPVQDEQPKEEICRRCSKKVYLVERKFAGNGIFHSHCFSCFICYRRLDSLNIVPRKGEIFCKQCYMKYYGPHIYGFGMNPNLHANN